ncbi:uncharacterized protein EURHEDRAFT_125112 [Aspergillus ruber CBS 135680]|uniref:Uncharacterized protein n=1 Tax=Aspergillus ruber (strain CBS 135680) TaxID=1388766 RepID=A0A017SS25_ASPRC|nr:uncharacterized protein EURHEDRAFT_125112 [Aspergillus ruber CBS 135680]EYE99045.1 hypothetical protein EURHEDRAFT_125112 [Aspergillus ruber CBS 135680]
MALALAYCCIWCHGERQRILSILFQSGHPRQLYSGEAPWNCHKFRPKEHDVL